MRHQGGFLARAPLLCEVGLKLHKLCVGILEHQFALLVPLFSSHHVAQRQEVGSLRQRRPPLDGVGRPRLALVCVAKLQFRYKLVRETHGEVGQFLRHLVKPLRMARHVFIGQQQGRKLIFAPLRRLPVVRQFSRHHMALEVGLAVDDARRGAQRGHRRLVIDLAAPAHGSRVLAPCDGLLYPASCLLMALLRRAPEGDEQSRQLEAHLATILVAAHARALLVV